MDEKTYLIWLNQLEGIGSKTLSFLIDYFGSARNVYFASKDSLLKMSGINEKIIHNIIQNRSQEKISNINASMGKLNVDILVKHEKEYPLNLRNIYDPPYILYRRGKLIPEDEMAVAIVGARKASHYGKWVAHKLAGDLAKRGITVISGMAYGIDTAAHQGALENGGRTIAVLGCGVDICYPQSNYQLMMNIKENGAILSEYPMGTPPLPNHFPARNRIISGMAKAVIVIEANMKSGSLITVDFALEQGRDVMAVPGNINSAMSIGTNKLIKEGAKMVTCVEDVLEELGLETEDGKGTEEIPLSPLEKDIYLIIKELQPIHIEMVASKLKKSIDTINGMITILQLKGLVELLPGKILINK